MNHLRGKTGSRTIRHIVVVFVFLLLVCSVGTITVNISRAIAAATMSGHTTQPVQIIRTVSSGPQIASNPPPESAPAVSSPNSSLSVPEPSSAVSSPKPAGSAGVVSKPVASVPPMNPAVYQGMYPDLYAEKAEPAVQAQGKVVYLTFDDGPSKLTMPLLDLLDHYKIKATFFLVGKTSQQDQKAMKEIVNRGHAIGVHSYTHILSRIYVTPAAFVDDFGRMHDLIQKTTGVVTHILRFAGGSVNDYNKNTARAIITEMNRRGYTYFDWNVSAGDAEHGSTASSIYSGVINGVHAHPQSVILCHDTNAKGNTLSEVPKIIETLLKEGYSFKTLDSSVDNRPYIFRVPKK